MSTQHFSLVAPVLVTNPYLYVAASGCVAPVATGFNVSGLTYQQAFDNPVAQQVKVSFFETHVPITVWDGSGYLAAGQWTDASLFAAISGLLAANPSGFVQSGFASNITSSGEHAVLNARSHVLFPSGTPKPAWKH